jgi:hypothetical protein
LLCSHLWDIELQKAGKEKGQKPEKAYELSSFPTPPCLMFRHFFYHFLLSELPQLEMKTWRKETKQYYQGEMFSRRWGARLT